MPHPRRHGLDNPIKAVITAALIGILAISAFAAVVWWSSGSNQPTERAPTPESTSAPSTVDDPAVTGKGAQLVHAQFVHDTVHGLEKDLKAAVDPVGACAQLCNPLPDPQAQLYGALRWCGQAVPAALANPVLDLPGVEGPLVAAYAEACSELLIAREEFGGVSPDAAWLQLAARIAARLEAARAEFRRAAESEGFMIVVNTAR